MTTQIDVRVLSREILEIKEALERLAEAKSDRHYFAMHEPLAAIRQAVAYIGRELLKPGKGE